MSKVNSNKLLTGLTELLNTKSVTDIENFLSQERLRVAVGGATLVNQLQAEQDWLDAQIRQVEVFGRREVARLTFMLAEGTLLLSHGVETPLPIEP